MGVYFTILYNTIQCILLVEFTICNYYYSPLCILYAAPVVSVEFTIIQYLTILHPDNTILDNTIPYNVSVVPPPPICEVDNFHVVTPSPEFSSMKQESRRTDVAT